MSSSRGRLVALGTIVVCLYMVLFGGALSITAVRSDAPAEPGPVTAVAALRERIDAYGTGTLTQRFELALAPGLHAAVGPTLPFYGALVAFVVFGGLIRSWRSVPRTCLGAVLSVALALALYASGTAVTGRPTPNESAELPVSEEWRFAWQTRGSYPSRHALIAGALAGSALIAWPPLGVAGCGLALAGGAAAIYFGAAHASDVLLGLLLGGGAAAAGRVGASVISSGRLE